MNDLSVTKRIAGHGAINLRDAARLCEATQTDMRGILHRLNRKGWLQVDGGQWTVTTRGWHAMRDTEAREGFG